MATQQNPKLLETLENVTILKPSKPPSFPLSYPQDSNKMSLSPTQHGFRPSHCIANGCHTTHCGWLQTTTHLFSCYTSGKRYKQSIKQCYSTHLHNKDTWHYPPQKKKSGFRMGRQTSVIDDGLTCILHDEFPQRAGVQPSSVSLYLSLHRPHHEGPLMRR